MSFANIVNVLPLAKEGKLRALAITFGAEAIGAGAGTADDGGIRIPGLRGRAVVPACWHLRARRRMS